MVLGDRTGLDPDSEEAFRASGTYHVLAISGAQVALLAALLAWPLRRAGAPALVTGLVVSASLLLYAQLVGAEVPVVRATCMALAVLLGLTLDLPSDLANLVGLAAAALLVDHPAVVGDVGFQLSFGATLGILLLTPPLLEHLPRLPLRLDVALAASLAAQATLAPLVAHHFARLAPAALLLNLAAVPLSGAILLAGLTTLALAAIGAPLVGLAADAAWLSAHALLRTGDLVRFWPWLDFKVAPPSAWAWLLHGAGFWAVSAARRRPGAALMAASVVAIVLGPWGGRADGRLHAFVLDVGQGDAIVVRSPNGRAMVIDAGNGGRGRSDAGARVVAPYLWSLGVRRLDRLVLSHAHPDHVGGAGFVAGAFAVGEVWEGPAPLQDASYSELARVLQAAGVARRTVTAGLRETWDGVELEVLGPPRPSRAPWRTRNDDSLVLLLRLGRVSLLFPGDIEAAGEARLAPRRVDVLKVAHHGSRTSTTAGFLAACAPRLALVSAGRRNVFGHPHPDVLERCRRQGSLVLRTDRDGALEVATDGTRLWLSSYRHGSSEIR
jgi:competence protein ComEC